MSDDLVDWLLMADSIEKVGFLELPNDWPEKPPFSTRLRKISVRMPLRKFWISTSGAYFFAMETETDFFNRIGRLLPVTTGRNRPIVLKKSVFSND